VAARPPDELDAELLSLDALLSLDPLLSLDALSVDEVAGAPPRLGPPMLPDDDDRESVL
jgi:hypothetical protein